MRQDVNIHTKHNTYTNGNVRDVILYIYLNALKMLHL